MNTQLGTPHHNPGYVRWLTNISVNANFNCVQRDWPCPCPCYMFCVFRQERGNLWCETSKEFAWACNTIKKTLLERRSTSEILLRSFLSSLLYLSRLSSIQKTNTIKKMNCCQFLADPTYVVATVVICFDCGVIMQAHSAERSCTILLLQKLCI